MMPPVGSILLWPSASAPPTGWQVCDGTNGTPDLADKTVPCAGSTYVPGATGGAFTIPLPAHSHGVGSMRIDPLDTGQGIHGHTWTYDTSTDSTPAGPYPSVPSGFGLKVGHAHTGTLDSIGYLPLETYTPNSHVHTISGTSASAGPPTMTNVLRRMGNYFICRLS